MSGFRTGEPDLHLKQMIDVDITHIGFRAHEFIPVWGEREDNCIPVKVKGKAEFPFEWKYFLKGETEESDDICWYVQKTLWGRTGRKRNSGLFETTGKRDSFAEIESML